MNWYLIKLVYQIICGDGAHQAQFDEQIKLILAAGEEEAYGKAMAAGKSGADVFYNQKQQLVQWKFIDIADMYRLSPFIDGLELHSSVKEADDASAYVNFVHHKARTIKQKYTLQLLNLT
jgi:hypothetical protein